MTLNKDFFDVALSTSVVVFGFENDQLKLLLCHKQTEPFKGAPALPTNWVKPNEEVDLVAADVLADAIGPNTASIEQLNAFSKLYRKPEGRVVNIAQITLIEPEYLQKEMASHYTWMPVCSVPTLIYDHDEIFAFARERLKRRIRRRPRLLLQTH